MPNISDSLMHKKFVDALEACESSNLLNDWETKFVEDIREHYNERETQADLGCTVWNPSSNQWNTLLGLSQRTGA